MPGVSGQKTLEQRRQALQKVTKSLDVLSTFKVTSITLLQGQFSEILALYLKVKARLINFCLEGCQRIARTVLRVHLYRMLPNQQRCFWKCEANTNWTCFDNHQQESYFLTASADAGLEAGPHVCWWVRGRQSRIQHWSEAFIGNRWRVCHRDQWKSPEGVTEFSRATAMDKVLSQPSHIS